MKDINKVTGEIVNRETGHIDLCIEGVTTITAEVYFNDFTFYIRKEEIPIFESLRNVRQDYSFNFLGTKFHFRGFLTRIRPNDNDDFAAINITVLEYY